MKEIIREYGRGIMSAVAAGGGIVLICVFVFSGAGGLTEILNEYIGRFL